MKKIFDGGYPAPLINGLQTCNCGAQFKDEKYTFEAMSSEFSIHPTNIISLYLATDNYKKVEISCWLTKNNDYDSVVYSIAYYSSYDSTHSHRYTQNISSKYEKYKEIVCAAHKKIFNGNKGK